MTTETRIQNENLLEVSNMKMYFPVTAGMLFKKKVADIKALDGVTFEVKRGETLGLVGESGCGKSMTALALLRMIPSPPGRITAGKVLLNDENLLTATKNRINSIRGKEISMIFQEPMSSLNPVYTVGNQIVETIRRHKVISSPKALEEAVELLRMVQIPAPDRRINEYPHQLSGGMRQ